jgi:hypothetical protein
MFLQNASCGALLVRADPPRSVDAYTEIVKVIVDG